MDYKFEGKRVRCEPPRRPKKITGTRFATIMGLNKWNTDFKTWCDITGVYREPFEDTIYTRAGKVIEPKQAQFMHEKYFMDIVEPEDIFGKDYFKTTRGDFFRDAPILGGMWDYLLYEDGKPVGVLEMKTTKRSEDWAEDIPEYYALQAALYAWLLDLDQVYMVCSMLEPGDYDHPEDFVPSVSNTIVRPFKVSERYPGFTGLVEYARHWWDTHVVGGISPEYDENADADVLKELRKTVVDTDSTDVETEVEGLYKQIMDLKAQLEPLEKRLKSITDQWKEQAMPVFEQGFKQACYTAGQLVFTVSRSVSMKLDEDAMKRDGIYDKYKTKASETVRVTVKNKEE